MTNEYLEKKLLNNYGNIKQGLIFMKVIYFLSFYTARILGHVRPSFLGLADGWLTTMDTPK